MKDFIEKQFLLIAENFRLLSELSGDLLPVVKVCTEALRGGNKILFCGNGGSAADAQHLAAELVGRYKLNRRAMNAMALTVDTSILTAVANDYGYEEVFARQVEGVGRRGDVLIGLSTSGNSGNVVKAMKLADLMGMVTVALTGQGGGEMQRFADYCIAVPSSETNHIQEMHIAVGHLLCELMEKQLYGES